MMKTMKTSSRRRSMGRSGGVGGRSSSYTEIHRTTMSQLFRTFPVPSKAVIRMSSSQSQSSSSHTSSLSSGRMCPSACAMCYQPFRRGDFVCESHNDSCKHVFHQKCVLSAMARADPNTATSSKRQLQKKSAPVSVSASGDLVCPCCEQTLVQYEQLASLSTAVTASGGGSGRGVGTASRPMDAPAGADIKKTTGGGGGSKLARMFRRSSFSGGKERKSRHATKPSLPQPQRHQKTALGGKKKKKGYYEDETTVQRQNKTNRTIKSQQHQPLLLPPPASGAATLMPPGGMNPSTPGPQNFVPGGDGGSSSSFKAIEQDEDEEIVFYVDEKGRRRVIATSTVASAPRPAGYGSFCAGSTRSVSPTTIGSDTSSYFANENHSVGGGTGDFVDQHNWGRIKAAAEAAAAAAENDEIMSLSSTSTPVTHATVATAGTNQDVEQEEDPMLAAAIARRKRFLRKLEYRRQKKEELRKKMLENEENKGMVQRAEDHMMKKTVPIDNNSESECEDYHDPIEDDNRSLTSDLYDNDNDDLSWGDQKPAAAMSSSSSVAGSLASLQTAKEFLEEESEEESSAAHQLMSALTKKRVQEKKEKRRDMATLGLDDGSLCSGGTAGGTTATFSSPSAASSYSSATEVIPSHATSNGGGAGNNARLGYTGRRMSSSKASSFSNVPDPGLRSSKTNRSVNTSVDNESPSSCSFLSRNEGENRDTHGATSRVTAAAAETMESEFAKARVSCGVSSKPTQKKSGSRLTDCLYPEGMNQPTTFGALESKEKQTDNRGYGILHPFASLASLSEDGPKADLDPPISFSSDEENVFTLEKAELHACDEDHWDELHNTFMTTHVKGHGFANYASQFHKETSSCDYGDGPTSTRGLLGAVGEFDESLLDSNNSLSFSGMNRGRNGPGMTDVSLADDEWDDAHDQFLERIVEAGEEEEDGSLREGSAHRRSLSREPFPGFANESLRSETPVESVMDEMHESFLGNVAEAEEENSLDAPLFAKNWLRQTNVPEFIAMPGDVFTATEEGQNHGDDHWDDIHNLCLDGLENLDAVSSENFGAEDPTELEDIHRAGVVQLESKNTSKLSEESRALIEQYLNGSVLEDNDDSSLSSLISLSAQAILTPVQEQLMKRTKLVRWLLGESSELDSEGIASILAGKSEDWDAVHDHFMSGAAHVTAQISPGETENDQGLDSETPAGKVIPEEGRIGDNENSLSEHMWGVVMGRQTPSPLVGPTSEEIYRDLEEVARKVAQAGHGRSDVASSAVGTILRRSVLQSYEEVFMRQAGGTKKQQTKLQGSEEEMLRQVESEFLQQALRGK